MLTGSQLLYWADRIGHMRPHKLHCVCWAAAAGGGGGGGAVCVHGLPTRHLLSKDFPPISATPPSAAHWTPEPWRPLVLAASGGRCSEPPSIPPDPVPPLRRSPRPSPFLFVPPPPPPPAWSCIIGCLVGAQPNQHRFGLLAASSPAQEAGTHSLWHREIGRHATDETGQSNRQNRSMHGIHARLDSRRKRV